MLPIIVKIFIGAIAAEHLYILWFEMFDWENRGKKIFKGKFTDEMFKATKGLAANQGLYNGFLAAGLIWSLLISNAEWQHNVAVFFLLCVAIAGIYGAATASRKIFVVQALPALITLVLVSLL
ncbi:DUF1304 domain-containing protein [Chitinophaga sp. Cy-1792]|uniref:DUF1304 domain-containing protein n=1 Tax=Chitinophaga sp. Cy-1792 TaxID=2608339 RepID=UPI0014232F41|nr:DUF1304 domain-containing protein [Chitinophaga sp. Cy-1792]NIG55121.1 DUF1304 domain-containing protein [Chitinophaga sp. Cy-1792]